MAGLIVTCARHFEPDACDEIEKILADLGDESAYAKATSMSGIITVETSLDPENAINERYSSRNSFPIPLTLYLHAPSELRVLVRQASLVLQIRIRYVCAPYKYGNTYTMFIIHAISCRKQNIAHYLYVRSMRCHDIGT